MKLDSLKKFGLAIGKETCIGQGIDVKVSLTCTEGAKTYVPELFEKEENF